jgi:hypothetical protein
VIVFVGVGDISHCPPRPLFYLFTRGQITGGQVVTAGTHAD